MLERRHCAICGKQIYTTVTWKKYCYRCAEELHAEQCNWANRKEKWAQLQREMDELLAKRSQYHPGGLDLLAAAMVGRAYLDGFTNDNLSRDLKGVDRYQAREWYRRNAADYVATLKADIELPCLYGRRK